MSFPGGLFAKPNINILGDSFILDPGVSIGGEPSVYARAFQTNQYVVSAPTKWDPQHSLITVSSYPVSTPVAVVTRQSSLQMVLEFTCGSALFGYNLEDTPPPPFPVAYKIVTTLSPEIRIDAGHSVVSLTAAMSFKVRFRHVSVAETAAVWGAGKRFGPRYRMNLGYGYGTPKSVQSWLTDVPTTLTIGGEINTNGVWAKPQFAEAVGLHVFGDPTKFNLASLGGYLVINFYDSNGNLIKANRYLTPFTSFPLIAWPASAYYMLVGTASLTSSSVPLTEIYVNPVHALNI